jgi:hypothetical protein
LIKSGTTYLDGSAVEGLGVVFFAEWQFALALLLALDPDCPVGDAGCHVNGDLLDVGVGVGLDFSSQGLQFGLDLLGCLCKRKSFALHCTTNFTWTSRQFASICCR